MASGEKFYASNIRLAGYIDLDNNPIYLGFSQGASIETNLTSNSVEITYLSGDININSFGVNFLGLVNYTTDQSTFYTNRSLVDKEYVDFLTQTDEVTITRNTAGQLVAIGASVDPEQIDDRVAALIQDGTTISWVYNDGLNTLTADIIPGSIDESYLALSTPFTGSLGDILTSDGTGGFQWVDSNSLIAKKSWSWGAASISGSNTDRFLDRHDGVATNLAPYIVWFDCKLKAISLGSDAAATWTAHVYVNGSSVAILASGGNQTAYTSSLNVSILAGDEVSFYLDGSTIGRPVIDALFEEA